MVELKRRALVPVSLIEVYIKQSGVSNSLMYICIAMAMDSELGFIVSGEIFCLLWSLVCSDNLRVHFVLQRMPPPFIGQPFVNFAS